MTSPNGDLIKELQVLYDVTRFSKESVDRFKAKSYKDAIVKISALKEKIVRDDQIPLKPTSKIYKKVQEFMETGQISEAQEILKKSEGELDLLNQLTKIAGIGPAKVKELREKHGIKSIEELEQRAELLNDKQRIGLKHWRTDALRIPHKEILVHQKLFKVSIKNLEKSCPGISFTITGSFRRNTPDSGDIDILLSHPTDNMDAFHKFVNYLIEYGYLADHLAYGDKKYMGYGTLSKVKSIPRRVDIIYCPPNEYPFAILYFTGSAKFNVRMREYATKKGYKLNEKHLVNLQTEELVDHPFKTEHDIFDFLGVPYVDPSKRLESHFDGLV